MSEPRQESRWIEPPTDLLGWVEWCLGHLGRAAKEQGRRTDFNPVLLTCNAAGMVVTLVGVGELLGSEEGKDYLGEELLPSVIRMSEATRYCWATSSLWGQMDRDSEVGRAYEVWREEQLGKGNLSLEGAPGVREGIMAAFGEWTGSQCMRFAPMTRYVAKGGDRWKLEPWENPFGKHGEDVLDWRSETAFRGRMTDDAMRALMGGPTSRELNATVTDLAYKGVVKELMLDVFLEIAAERGLTDDQIASIVQDRDPDESLYMEMLEEAARRLGEDEEKMAVIRAAIIERTGPVSPIRG